MSIGFCSGRRKERNVWRADAAKTRWPSPSATWEWGDLDYLIRSVAGHRGHHPDHLAEAANYGRYRSPYAARGRRK
jgi:hypothetical protein